MMRRALQAAALAAGTLLWLTACGGGGGGGDGGPSPGYPLSLTVTQNPISATIAQIDLPASVSISATVRGTTSANTLYVVIVDANATFSRAASVRQSGANEYLADLSLAETLAVGTYSGNLQISICGDPGCANVLGRTTAPYSIGITENPVVTGTWSRATVSLAAIQGDEQVTWPVSFTTPSTPALKYYIPYARFSDSAGILQVSGESQTVLAPEGTKNVELVVSPNAAAGTHRGNLDMVYCRDAACSRTWRGVTQLPYTVSVYPGTNLKPMVRLEGAPDWNTFQGSSARTGHVAATLNPTDFSPRWRWSSPDPASLPEVLEPVSSAGKAFTIAAPPPWVHHTPLLVAIDEATGAMTWQQPIPDTSDGPTAYGLGPLIPPAIAGENVYVARTVNIYTPREGRFFAFRLSDGAATFAPHSFPGTPGEFVDDLYPGTSVRPTYMTPHNGSMLVARGDADASVQTFAALDLDAGSHTDAWPSCARANSVASAGAIAVDANERAYVVTGNSLLMPDTCEQITSAQSLADGTGPVIVPGTSSVVAVGSGNLTVFDSATRAVKWSAPVSSANAFSGSPVIVGTTVHVLNNGSSRLEARRESDGDLLWSWRSPWPDDTSFRGNVVATDNLVFVSTIKRVYAIDLATHETVWTYPYSGRLAVSANGLLFVLRGSAMNGGTSLAAINLR